MAGKNKTELGFRILWGTDDLTGDLIPGSVTGGGKVLDEVDMLGVSETVRNFLAGHASAPISARFHVNDTASTGTYTILKTAAGTTGTLTLQWGAAGAAPTSGDPEWESTTYRFLGFGMSFDAGRAVMEASWTPGSATAPAWGTVSA